VRTAEADAATGAPVWSAWQTLPSGGIIGQAGRYAQYEVTLATTAVSSTPVVKEVALSFLK
jgi:hypothetical protein